MKKTERLDKLLAHAGFGTRSEIRKLVKAGAVTVGGQPAKDSGMQVDPEAGSVQVNGEPVLFREYVYLMLHKPPGYVSATEDNRDRTVLELIGRDYRHFELFPVGRLDKDTEGLLLLTNDGQLAHNLLSPKKHVPKTYYAEVDGQVTDADREAFRRGAQLDDGYITLPAELNILEEGNPAAGHAAKVELTIHEGKFHQVKRMFQSTGKTVVYLKRLSMGTLRLDDRLKKGEYRELTGDELEGLRRYHELQSDRS
ncbi:pseudouridine synthase [Gorillibacterium massiliense]|uniref:pseudouridine synthase n=1 Tax=Gorillibacterium massiliense TaxID=1280390 RepID=UPI0004AC81F6|nr:pseudouridine synthase [Gorillibacterium massiliense]